MIRRAELLSRVRAGEEVTICRGDVPVARLVPMEANAQITRRPRVGTVTSGPLQVSEDCFAPLTEEELREWGL